MKSLTYSSWQKVSCACAPADVVLCVDESITASGAPFIEGTLATVRCQNDGCGRPIYVYGITYDEVQLLDPDTNLAECDVTGIFCDSCLTNYLIWKASPFKACPTGDNYIYVLPCGPPPMADGDPFAFDIDHMDGYTVYLKWHSITPEA